MPASYRGGISPPGPRRPQRPLTPGYIVLVCACALLVLYTLFSRSRGTSDAYEDGWRAAHNLRTARKYAESHSNDRLAPSVLAAIMTADDLPAPARTTWLPEYRHGGGDLDDAPVTHRPSPMQHAHMHIEEPAEHVKRLPPPKPSKHEVEREVDRLQRLQSEAEPVRHHYTPPAETDSSDARYAGSRVPDNRKDEQVFEEEHQQAVLRIYGGSAGSGNGNDDAAAMNPESATSNWDYAITVDCGSKGSRIHIFKWLHRHSASSIPPFSPLFTKHAWTSSVTPGISTFVDAPEKSIEHFRKLLDFAMASLSEFRYKWHRTPIYVKATAGMRLIKNLPSRDRIMETIRTFLEDPHNSPFYFERSMARVISGEEEGVYGWLTTNYLAGTLLHASSATSLGVLDMGGASVQITFRPPFDVLGNYFPLRIQQERIRLYTHSFLNFGADMALQRVNDRILSMGGNETDDTNDFSSHATRLFYLGEFDGVRSFRHPCFPLGYSFTYEYVSTRDLRQSYTGFSSRSWQTDDDGADMSPITTYSAANWKREMVHFSGGGDFNNCSAITWQLLHKREACFDNTCSFDGIYQPRFGNVTFVACSGFVRYTRELMGLAANATIEDIDHASRAVCALTWQQLQDKYRYTPAEQLASLCFSARYVFTMLYKGFGFPYRGHNLLFQGKLQGLELDWALGSTLYEVQALPWDLDPGAENFRFNIGVEGATSDEEGVDEDGPEPKWVGQPRGTRVKNSPPVLQQDASPFERHEQPPRASSPSSSPSPPALPQPAREREEHASGPTQSHSPHRTDFSKHHAKHAASSHHKKDDPRAKHAKHSSRTSHSASDDGRSSAHRVQELDHAQAEPQQQQQQSPDSMLLPPGAPQSDTSPRAREAPAHQQEEARDAPVESSREQPADEEPTSVRSPTEPSDEVASSFSQADPRSRYLWALLGGLSVGWFVTLVAFAFCMHQSRRQIRHLESLAVRYEPVREV